MKTYAPKPKDVERRWYLVDAGGVVLGRLASEVAKILRGKHKPIFAPNADTGDHVVVVNARGVRLTGGKETKKIAYHHSGYPGGLREVEYERLLRTRPTYVIEKAVKGMLPKNRLGRAMAHKLKVYAGADHPHGAQNPVPLTLGEVPKWDGLPTPEVKPAPEPKTAETDKPARRKPARKSPTRKSAAEKPPAPKKPTARRAPAKTHTSRRSRPKKES